MHRFFVPSQDINQNTFSSTDKELCHQVSKVLKMRAGKSVILLNDNEEELTAEWTTVSRSVCEAQITEKKAVQDIGSKTPVHLFVPPLKNQNRWELILEKGTEIGVASFTPLMSKRTEVDALRKPERLHRIIKEAAEQSGRTKLPELNDPVAFEPLMELCNGKMEGGNMMGFIASLQEKSLHLPELIKKEQSSRKAEDLGVNILIGPVGDFSDEELELAEKAGFKPFTLGSQILRTETAAITSAALCLLSEAL